MRRLFFGNRFGRKTRFLGMAVVMAVGLAAVGGLVMLLWNWLMPALFTGAGYIDYWRALGLLLLCKILFGGGRGHWHARRHQWHGMSPDERAQFHEHFKRRWERHVGPDHHDGATTRPPTHGRDSGAPTHDPIA